MRFFNLGRKGQITRTEPLREDLAPQLDDRETSRQRDDDPPLKPAHRSIFDLAGSVTPKHQPENFEAIRREVAAARGRQRSERDPS